MFKPSIYQCELTAYSSCCQARKQEGKRETGGVKPDHWVIRRMKANWKATGIVKIFAPHFFLLITGDPPSSTFLEQFFWTFLLVYFVKSKVSFLSACNIHKPEEYFLAASSWVVWFFYRMIPLGLFPPFPTGFIPFLNLVSYKSTCNW